ncbi:MAG: hypothetical protein WC301_04685, partial [Candidatus Omnitrophota bacterium]
MVSGLTQAGAHCGAADDECYYDWDKWNATTNWTGAGKNMKVFWDGDPLNVTRESEPFIVRGTINLTAPDGGETWFATRSESINWTKTGSWIGDAVNITYSILGGSDNAIQLGANASNQTYLWENISEAAISPYVKIKVESVEPYGISVSDGSGDYFNISPEITADAPATDQNIIINTTGQDLDIDWTIIGNLTTVHCWYSSDGDSWNRMTPLGGVSAAGESFTWTNPNITLAGVAGEGLYIRVANFSGDGSPGIPSSVASGRVNIRGKLFSTSPANGEILRVNQTNVPISWSYEGMGPAEKVRIKFSPDGSFSGFYHSLARNQTITNGSWNWPLVYDNITSLGSPAKMRVEWEGNSTVYDDSETFYIKGVIDITSMLVNATKQIGEIVPINWTVTGSIGVVDINYTINDLPDQYNHTITSVDCSSPGAYKYNWTIPTDVEVNEKVRIKVLQQNDGANVNDTSDGLIAIRGTIALTEPVDEGLIWKANTSHYINWSTGGLKMTGNMLLNYSIDNGETWAGYIDSVPAGGATGGSSYSWTVPDVWEIFDQGSKLFNEIRIKASYGDNTTHNTTYPVYFVPDFKITFPDTGHKEWYVDENMTINWTCNGSVDKVNISLSVDGNTTYDRINIIDTLNGTKNDGTWTWKVGDYIGNNRVIRICNYNDNDTIPGSGYSVLFNISGGITDVKPGLNENLTVDDQYQIQWSSHGTIGNVNITLLPDNDTIATDESGPTFDWNPVPDRIGTGKKIRIESAGGVTSDSELFNILGAVNLTAPNGGETYLRGSYCNITWIPHGTIGTLNISYSINNGTDGYPYVINNSVDSSLTYYNWTIPGTLVPSEETKIRVRSNSLPYANDSSFLPFRIAHLQITEPVGGENWSVNTTKFIKWSSGAIDFVNLYYSLDNGSDGTWNAFPGAIGENIPASYNNITWDIPWDQQVSNWVKIKIEDTDNTTVVYDTNDNTFAIKAVFDFNYPENGNPVIANETYDINWTKKGIGVSNVTLQYRISDVDDWRHVNALGDNTVPNTGPPGYGVYTWNPVPGDILSGYCKLKITDPNNPNATDTSSGYFYIRGKINVTTPTKDASWQVNNSYYINWTYQGNITGVNIYYSPSNGTGGWTKLNTGGTIPASGNSGSWLWNISASEDTTTIGRINITDVNDEGGTFALSNGTFYVKGNVILGYPDGPDLNFLFNDNDTQQMIIWTEEGSIPAVQIRYSNDSGVSYNTIIANVTGTGGGNDYGWFIPDDIGSNCSIMVMDKNDSSVNDTSANLFAIKGMMVLLEPYTSVYLSNDTPQNISFKTIGTYKNNIELYYRNATAGDWIYIDSVSPPTSNVTANYTWYPPDDLTNNASIKLSTSETEPKINADATSPVEFKIMGKVTVTKPGANEIWHPGDTKYINWTSVGTVNPVKIEISNDTGATWKVITNNYTGVSGYNNYSWQVWDNISSESCIVRVSDNRTGFGYMNDTSNATFYIRPYINISDPKEGDNVTVNQIGTVPIRWNYTGT